MVVPALGAATMLVCNIALMKMTASFSFTSLQHQVASFTTAAMRPELQLTPVRLLKWSVKNLRGELSQQLIMVWMSFTIKLKRPVSTEIKRSASLAMAVKVLGAATMLVCNIVLMKLNAISSFTSLQRLDAFFTTAVTRQELLHTLALPSRLQTWTSCMIKPNWPVSTESRRSVSLVMVVQEPDAATMLVCNTVLMKMTASFSFTSLQHQDASSTTAAMRLEFLLILARLSKSSVKSRRGAHSQWLSKVWMWFTTKPQRLASTVIRRSTSRAMVVKVLGAVMMLAWNIVWMKMIVSFSFTSLQHQDASSITVATRSELLLTPEQPSRSLVLQLRQHKLPQVWTWYSMKPSWPVPMEIKRSASLVMVVKVLDAATTRAWNIVSMNPIASSFFTSLQRPDVFFTTAVTRPGLLHTPEPPLKSHGIKASTGQD